MSTRFGPRMRLSLVLSVGLFLGAGLAPTAPSAWAEEEEVREGCMQIAGSGNCDWCRSWCAPGQVCCPLN